MSSLILDKRLPFCLLVLLICAAVWSPARAADSPPLTAKQKEQLKERDRLLAEMRKRNDEGRIAAAIDSLKKALAIERRVFGDVHRDVAESLKWLMTLSLAQEDFAAARQAARESLAAFVGLHGEKHWIVTDARLDLAYVDELARLKPEQRQQLRLADRLGRQSEELGDQEKYDEALPLAEQALQIRKKLLGNEHWLTSKSLIDLGWLYREKGDYAKAETLYQQGLTIHKRVLGEDHPWYGAALNNLGWLHTYRQKYERAEALFQRAAAIHRRAKGEGSSSYKTSLNNLIQLYTRMAHKYEKAEDVATGRSVRTFEGLASSVWSVAFSVGGRRLLIARADSTARLWEAESGNQGRSFRVRGNQVLCGVLSPDGRLALTHGLEPAARLWETATGKEIRSLPGDFGAVTGVAFSTDGLRILTGSGHGTARLWETASGKLLCTYKGHTAAVTGVAFSPDGRRVLTGSRDKTARLWETDTGKEVRRFQGHTGEVLSVAFSPDGHRVLTGSGMAGLYGGRDNTARLWETDTGKEVHRFQGHSGQVTAVAFSSDGRRVLTGSGDTTARLWEADTGKEIRAFVGHSDWIHSAVFSPDGRWVLTGSWDGSARLWEAANGKESCRLISFRDGTWAVVDPDGRFDASNGGNVHGLHWVIDNESIDLVQLKERYYDPGLLAKKLGFNKEPLATVEAFTDPKLYPAVKLTPPTLEKPKLQVMLSNRGGGIGRVVVKINGKELTADARPRGADPHAKTLRLEIPLADDPRLKPGEDNRIEVQAFNAEGYLRSRGMIASYVHRGQAHATPPEVWAIVAGVSKFRGETLELRYAAKDADDFARALQVAANGLFGKDHVHLTVLTSSQADADRRPTRANLVRTLEEVRKAKPADVLVLYLAGHGVNYGGQDGDFYYLTADARSADLTDPEVRKQTALSSRELTELIKKVPVERQVLVLDTCAAARAVERLTDKRDVPSSQCGRCSASRIAPACSSWPAAPPTPSATKPRATARAC
jgi:WD40 repeat protein